MKPRRWSLRWVWWGWWFLPYCWPCRRSSGHADYDYSSPGATGGGEWYTDWCILGPLYVRRINLSTKWLAKGTS